MTGLWELYQEAMLATMIVPIRQEITIFSLHQFQQEITYIMLITSMLGAFTGYMFSYVLGESLTRLLQRYTSFIKPERLSTATRLLGAWGLILLPFVWINPLAIVPWVMGLVRVPIVRVAPLLLLAAVLRYNAIWLG